MSDISDKKESNYSEDSIENTRRKKMDEFEKNFDKSVMERDYDYANFEPSSSDEGSKTSYSTDSTPLRKKKRTNEINSFSDSDTKKRIERDSKKALKQQKKEDKKIEKSKAKRNKKLFKWVWLSMILFVAIILASVIMVGVNDMLAIGRDKNPTKVKISIPENPTISQIATILAENGVINRADYFAAYANITSDESDFRKGEFEIETDKDYEAIINFLQSNNNRSDIVTVQLTEGMNVLEIANKLHEEGVITDVQKFLDICNSDKLDEDFPFIKDIDNASDRYYKLEGYLFPDTYNFYLAEDPEEAVYKMLSNFDNKVNHTKERYFGNSKKTLLIDEINDTDYSLDEIVTIASIIQAEAANKEDMYTISSILHNRLSYGTDAGVSKLDCDSTVFYPYRKKSDVPDSIKDSFTSSYDTYSFSGLPAGPICNPSLEALKAAVSPYDTEYLYFCHASAEDGGTPYYATNMSDHLYNLQISGND